MVSILMKLIISLDFDLPFLIIHTVDELLHCDKIRFPAQSNTLKTAAITIGHNSRYAIENDSSITNFGHLP